MFGRHWQRAEGTLVDIRVSRVGPGDNSAMVRHFVMDIRPSSGDPFRTEVREPLMTASSFNGPTIIGQRVTTLECDVARKKARFRRDREAQLADDVAAMQAEGERLDAQEHAEAEPHPDS